MIDQFYLALLNPIIALSFAIVVALLWRRWPGHSHFFPLSLAFLYLGLGFITQDWPLFTQPGAINYAGNTFFFAAVVLACMSTLVRAQSAVPVGTFVVISAIAAVGFMYFSVAYPSTLGRILLLNGCFVALAIVTVLKLIAAGTRDVADRMFIGAVVLGALLAIARTAMVLTGHLDIDATSSLSQTDYWASVSGITPLFSILVISAFVFALVVDVVAALKREADHDYLTGLLNRRGFELAAMQDLETSERGQALLVADIDDFKQINDRFGHATGDKVIAAIGRTLARHGGADLSGRTGGEEFALYYRSASVEQLEQVAQDIRGELEKLQIDGLPNGLSLTISIGLHRREAGEVLEDMQVRADRALYQAKAAGKNRAVLSPARLTMV